MIDDSEYERIALDQVQPLKSADWSKNDLKQKQYNSKKVTQKKASAKGLTST